MTTYTYTVKTKTNQDVTDPGLSGVVLALRRLDEDYAIEHVEGEPGAETVVIRTAAYIGHLLDGCDAVVEYTIDRR
jgi:hypothetical protein